MGITRDDNEQCFSFNMWQHVCRIDIYFTTKYHRWQSQQCFIRPLSHFWKYHNHRHQHRHHHCHCHLLSAKYVTWNSCSDCCLIMKKRCCDRKWNLIVTKPSHKVTWNWTQYSQNSVNVRRKMSAETKMLTTLSWWEQWKCYSANVKFT